MDKALSSEEQAACCGSCSASPPDLRTVSWLQGITIGWMVVECAGALLAAAQARSVALLAFGADSLIELFSAIVVLLQFAPRFRLTETTAARIAGVLLYLLAGAVVLIAILSLHSAAETSLLGIGITAGALIAMPMLAALKRRQARSLGNRALAADATQSATCAYLAAVTLAGLAVNALWHIRWIDSVAALGAVPVLVIEARRTSRGEGCGCC